MGMSTRKDFLKVLSKLIKKSCLGKTSRFALGEVQVPWDESQQSCLYRTMALYIQFISDSRISTAMLPAEPHLYFFLILNGNEKPAHNTQNWETPLTWLQLFDIHFLSFFHDCHTHWQASRVQMLSITKFPRNFVLALPKLPSLNKTTHSTVSGNHNFCECSSAALPLPAVPGSLRDLSWGITTPEHLKPPPGCGVWAKHFKGAQGGFRVSIASKIQKTSDAFLRCWS